jgi:ribonuclease Z
MFTVTFLGTSGGMPTVDRAMPSISIRYGKYSFLWDCGEGTQRQMMKYKTGYGSIDAIFITHAHLDHYLGLFGLFETLNLSGFSKTLQLFLPSSMVGMFDRYKFIEQKKLRSGTIYKSADFSISAFKVKHVKDSFGFSLIEFPKRKFNETLAHSKGLKGSMFREIQEKGSLALPSGKVTLDELSYLKDGRKLVYGGDCAPSKVLTKAAENADLLIHESTFASDHSKEAKERKHSTCVDAAKIAKEANVKNLTLTHFSPRYSDLSMLLKEARSIYPNTQIAFDGLNLTL